jgi:phospholipid/cholesterol/gamma-HCH transport system substrate-binding protein
MSSAFRLGSFIVLALFIFAGGVFWIGNRQFLFNSTYRLNADFPNAAGLLEGAVVRVGGIPEGTVRSIELPKHVGEKIRVAMDLKQATRQVIKKDSRASIQAEGLLGDQYVEIFFGTDKATGVKDGDVIGSDAPLQMADILKKDDGILDSAQQTMDSVQDTATNLKDITGKVNRGSGTVGALVNDKELYRHATAAVSSLDEDTEALKHNFLLRGFFKDRGYEDAATLKQHELQTMPAGQPVKQFSYEGKKLFDKPTSAKLSKGKMLNDAGAFLEHGPFGEVVIVSNTDAKGESEKAKVLTEARAMIVRNYLIEHFKLDDRRVKTMGKGKAENAPEGGTIEILVYPTPKSE